MYLFGFHLNLRRQECLVKTQPDRCMFHSVCTFFLDEESQMVVILCNHPWQGQLFKVVAVGVMGG